MDIAHLDNPYDYANPVRNGAVFAGREPELSRIAYVLTQSGLDRPVGYVAVYGQRAAGKTSVLNMVEPMARDRGFLVIRLNLVPADASPIAFLAKLIEELVDGVDRAVGLTASDGSSITARQVRRIANGIVQDDSFPLEFPENVAHMRSGGTLSEMALRHDLVYLVQNSGRPIAVLVDEAQLIADSENALSILRTLGMQLRGFVFILAGTMDLIDRIDAVFDHLLRQFEFVKVDRFIEVAEVQDCMARPLKSIGLLPEECFDNLDDVVFDLMVLTDGNPYEVQLVCHVMFTRWQNGEASMMKLSSEALDDVLTTLDQRRDHRDHSLIDKVKQLPKDQLLALNVLCSAMLKATLRELTFANFIYAPGALSQEELDSAQDTLIAAGIIEIESGKVRLTGSLFDQIYTRLWTLSNLGITHHAQLINTLNFKLLLGRQLEYILCDTIAQAPARQLRTCCLAMDQSHLDAGLAAITKLDPKDRGCFTVEYLHEAITESGMPAALDITTVECSFDDITATRWIYSADVVDYDVTREPKFIAAQQRAYERGGKISAQRIRTPLPPSSQLLKWLTSTAQTQSKVDTAHFHEMRFNIAYAQGDLAVAAESLEAAYNVAPTWRRANNLSYVLLKADDTANAADWARKAKDIASASLNRALSGYNLAMAVARDGEREHAIEELSDIANQLTEDDYVAMSLLIPRLADESVEFDEQFKVSLRDAVAAALRVLSPS
jgi:AAA ATPase domain